MVRYIIHWTSVVFIFTTRATWWLSVFVYVTVLYLGNKTDSVYTPQDIFLPNNMDKSVFQIFVDNFVHGDLHPGNILVQSRGHVAGPSDGAAELGGKTTLTDLWDTVVVSVRPDPVSSPAGVAGRRYRSPAQRPWPRQLQGCLHCCGAAAGNKGAVSYWRQSVSAGWTAEWEERPGFVQRTSILNTFYCTFSALFYNEY